MTDKLFDLPPEPTEPERKPWEDVEGTDRVYNGPRPDPYLDAQLGRKRKLLREEQERARARNTDPEESHDAAASVTNLTEKQEALLACLREANWPLSDPEIADYYRDTSIEMGHPPQSESGLRTRRSELVRKGLVEAAGTTTLITGRQAKQWKVTDQRSNDGN